MFYRDGILEKSSLLDEADLYHGFSTRGRSVRKVFEVGFGEKLFSKSFSPIYIGIISE